MEVYESTSASLDKIWTQTSQAKVFATEPDKEGLVRSVSVKTSTTELRRPINQLVILLKADEQEKKCIM